MISIRKNPRRAPGAHPQPPAVRRSPPSWRPARWLLAAAFALFAGAGAHAALSASPNPSANGSYTVSWTAITGASHYQLLEDGAQVHTGTSRSKAFADKAPGKYRYTLSYCITVHVPPLLPSRSCGLASGFAAVTVTVPKPTPKPTVNASFDKASIILGKSATLTWSSTDATRCSGRPHIGSSATSGSKTYTPKDAGTFGARVYCSGPGGTAYDDASVKVHAPPTVEAEFDKSSITLGESVTLEWDSEHATRCSGSPALGSTATAGSKTFTPNKTGTFRATVTCTGAGGTGNATDTVRVAAKTPKPTVTASFSPASITVGGSATLTWDSEDATRCTGSPAIGSTAASGTKEFTRTVAGTFRVKVTCTGAGGSGSATASLTVGALAKPAAPAAIDCPARSTSGAYTVTWDASTGATRYELEEKHDAGSWTRRHNGAATRAAFTGKAPGIYRYRAKACNAAGCSPATAACAVKVPPPAPGAIQGPASSVTGDYTLTWAAATGATKYKLEERAGTGSWRQLQLAAATSRTFDDRADGTYRYRASGCNSAGCGPATAEKTVVVLRPSGDLAATPNPSTDGSFTVSWKPLAGAAGYVLEERAAGGVWPVSKAADCGTATSKSFTGKTEGTYEYRLRACIAIPVPLPHTVLLPPGQGVLSVLVASPPTVTASFSPASITVGGSATLTWDSEDATRCTGSPAIGSTAASGTKEFTRTVAGTFRVKVTCTGAGGSRSATASLVVRPLAAPAAIDCPARSTSGAYTVTWDASTGATRYELEEKHDAGSWTRRHNGAATRAAFTGKAPGIYRYRAKACNAAGCSPATAACAVKVPPPAPGAIQGPASSVTGDYTLTWAAATGATKYKLEERAGTGSWRQLQLAAATSRTFDDRADGTYRYRASGCNSAGCGPATAEKTVVVLRPSGDLAATPNPSTDGSFTVSWKPLAGAAGYVLEERAAGGVWPVSKAADCGTATSKSFTGKTEGTHEYRLRACIAIPVPLPHTVLLPPGQGVLSVTVEFPPPTPGAIAGPAVAADGAYTLTWGASAGAARHELEEHDGDGVWTNVHDAAAARAVFDEQPSAVYTYRVRACKTRVCSGWTATKKVAVLQLSAAPNPSADGAYTVSWKAVANATRYRLAERDGQGVWQQVQEGTSRSRDYTGQTDGGHYYRFAPRIGTAWESWSDPLTVTVARPALAAPAVDGPAASATGTFDLTWTAVTGAASYRLEERSGDGAWREEYDGPKTTHRVTDRADGDWSYRAFACDANDRCSKPGATHAVTVQRPGTGTVTTVDDTATVDEDGSVDIDVLANDGASPADVTLSLASVTEPGHGTAVLQGGLVRYAPATDWNGDDTFEYTATAGTASGTGTVTVTVTPVNDAPVAKDDAAHLAPGATEVQIDVLDNDADVDGDALSLAAIVTAPSHGTAQIASDKVVYEPGASFRGSATGDGFTYRVSDGTLADTARVTVTGGDAWNLQAEYEPHTSRIRVWWNAQSGATRYVLRQRWDVPVPGVPGQPGTTRRVRTEHSTASTVLRLLSPGAHEYAFEVRGCTGDTDADCGAWSVPLTLTVRALKPPFGDPSPLAKTTVPGNLPYDTGVTRAGDAYVNVPIAAAPGVADLAPQLSIDYGGGRERERALHQEPGDTLGQGWRLSGLSKVHRCVTHGTGGTALELDDTDGLCLDGEPLARVSGNHLRTGAGYRTLRESFVALTLKGTAAASWFEARFPDGTVRQYGNSDDSRLQVASTGAQRPVLAWSVNRETDAHGNVMTFAYHEDEANAVRHPMRIDYGASTDAEADASVRFWYTGREDVDGVSLATLNRRQHLLLHRVDVVLSDKFVRQYRLASTLADGRRRLTGIQLCAYDQQGAAPQCLAALKADWTTSNAVLSGITDPMGRATTFGYGSITHAGDAGEPSFTERPFGNPAGTVTDTATLVTANNPKRVVQSIARDDGIGGKQVTQYAYQGKGLVSTRNWGVLGFHATRVTDAASGIATYYQYRHDFPYLAEVSAVHRSHGVFGAANAKTLSRVETEYARQALTHAAGNTVFPYAAARTEFVYEQGAHIGTAVTANTPTFKAGLLDGAKRETIVGHGPAPAKPPANAVWGAVAKHAPTQVQRRTVSTVKFTNRTDAGRWLLGFPKETVLGYYADAQAATQPGRTIRTTAAPAGNTLLPKTATRFPGDAKLQLKTDYLYDARGNPTSLKVSGANVTARESKASNFVAGRYPGKLTNAVGHVEKLTHDPRFGSVATHTDANGRTTTIAYDGFGRETSRVTPDGVTVATSYTRCGPCPKVGAVAPAMAVRVRSPIAPDTTRHLDALGRTIRTQTVSFDGASQRTVDVAYDARGRVASVSEPYHAVANAKIHRTTYTHDHRDRVTREVRPDGGSVAIQYARLGNGVRVTRTETVAETGKANATRTKTSEYNVLGELVRTTDAAGTTAAATTVYAHDVSGLLDTVTVDGARRTDFDHDAAGRRTAVSSPNFGTVTFAHTALGELLTRTDARQKTTTYAHDKLGRLLTATDADGVSRWVYDGTNGKGRLARRCRSTTVNANCANVGDYRETFAWNADARLAQRTTEIADGATTRTYVHAHGYLGDGDPNVRDGRLATITYPSGLTVRREYNARGYLTRLVNAATNAALETYAARDAYGNVRTETHGNGATTTRAFQTGTPRLTRVNTARGATTLRDDGYRWRSNGILAQRTAPGLEETFAHDGLDRLRTATAKRNNARAALRTLTAAYGADRLGNYTDLTSSVSADPQVAKIKYGERVNTAAPGVDAVTAATIDGIATDLEYDAAGNVTRLDRAAGDDRFVVWNARNLATSVTEGSSATTTSPTAREEFQYGPSGSRYLRDSTWKPPAGALGGTAARRARTFHAGGFEETHAAAGDRTTVVSRTRVTDNVVLVRERVRSGGTLRAASERVEYLHRDHLGSVVAVSNAAGRATHRLAYDPYGARRAADWSRALTPAESAAVSDAQPRGFTGHEHLDRVGLIHANARLYDPRLGRYLSPDPAVSDPTHSQSWNGYAYVANSPLSFTDPTGMVRAGPGCNVGGVMCLDDGAGGHADSPATYPEPYSVRVTIPVVTPFSVWGGGAFGGYGLPGEGGFGGAFGWLGGYTVRHASINVSGVIHRSTGSSARGPGDRPIPLFTSPTVAFIVSVGVGALPVMGSVQSVVELATGYDYIAGEAIDRRIALIGIAVGVVPGAKAALKIGGRVGSPKVLLLPSPRRHLLDSVKSPTLRKAINELYRPGAKIGDGGTADMIRHERRTGRLYSATGHEAKGQQRRTQLRRILDDGSLDAGDQAIAQRLIDDLDDALKGP